jgi:hypothetical protein
MWQAPPNRSEDTMPIRLNKRASIGTSAPGSSPAQAPLPHERDESKDMTGGIPSEPMRQAFRDLRRGLQDTDRGAEADRTYKKLKR